MAGYPQLQRSLSQASKSEVDLEKQTIENDVEQPSDEGTTVVGDAPEPPSPPSKQGLKRSISDYIRNVSLPGSGSKLSQEPPSQTDVERRIKCIDLHPEGYPQVAALLNSDDNFSMCRRFGFLHQRVLLYRQDELRELEDQLVMMDDEDKEDMPRALKSRDLDDSREVSITRKALIQEIDDKLKEYSDIIDRMRTFSTYKAASTRNYQSVRNWLVGTRPLADGDMEFIRHKSDLVMVPDGDEGGWFDGYIEDMLSKVPCRRLTRLFFTSREQRLSSDDDHIHLYSKNRINTLVRLLICILAVILLMAPVVVLFIDNQIDSATKIGVIVLFTMFFATAISVVTRARRHEVFAATVA